MTAGAPTAPATSASATAAIRGIVAAMLTPIRPDLAIDVERMHQHLDRLLAAGCSFVSPFGSTGEGPSFSTAQKLAVLAELKARGVAMERVIPASMTTSVADATAMILGAHDLGCRAVLVLPPFYYGGAGQDGIELFFAACAAQAGGSFPIDIILYHIPALSKIPYGVELVARLVATHGPRIVGIKDSTGNQDHTLMLARSFPQLAIFTGDDRVLPALLEAGGAGMIGGMPNVVARDLCAFLDDPRGRASASAKVAAALRIQAVDQFGGIAALKGLVAAITGDTVWARPMPPLTAIDGQAMERLQRAFVDTGFAFGGPTAG